MYLAVGLGALSLVGTAANLVVILVVACRPALRTPMNAYIVSLAVSDCLVCMFHIPSTIVLMWRPLPDALCQMLGFIGIWTLFMSLINMAAVATNRLGLITCKWEVYRKYFSKQAAIAVLLVLWLFGGIMAIMPLLRFGSLGYNHLLKACLFTGDVLNYIYIQVIGHVLIAWPSMVWTGTCYLKIYRHYRRVAMQVEHHRPPIFLVHSSGFNSNANSTNGSQGRSAQKPMQGRYRVAKILFILWITFLLCWTPLITMYTIDFNQRVSPSLYFIFFCFACGNSAINPVLYIVMNKNFRKALLGRQETSH